MLLALLAASLPSYAFFKCDLNYTAEGQNVKAVVQIEGKDSKKLIVIREARSKEDQNEGVIAAARLIKTERTAISQIVHGEMNFDGIKLPLSVVLPAVLPGPGTLITGDASDSESEVLSNCRRK